MCSIRILELVHMLHEFILTELNLEIFLVSAVFRKIYFLILIDGNMYCIYYLCFFQPFFLLFYLLFCILFNIFKNYYNCSIIFMKLLNSPEIPLLRWETKSQRKKIIYKYILFLTEICDISSSNNDFSNTLDPIEHLKWKNTLKVNRLRL